MTTVHFFRMAMASLCIVMLQGCGIFRSPVEIPSSVMELAAHKDRTVNVFIMGGAQLNPGNTGQPRPIQLCVYLVADKNWQPESWLDENKCHGTITDFRVFGRERRTLVPDQVQQVNLKMPSDKDGWVLIDADFGTQAVTSRGALRLKTSSGEFSSHLVIINGTRIFDGMSMQGVPQQGQQRGANSNNKR
jgi:type VI secretion system protein VasD